MYYKYFLMPSCSIFSHKFNEAAVFLENCTLMPQAQYSAVQALTTFQSLLGGAVLIFMICFARAALQSSNTKINKYMIDWSCAS